MSSQTLRPTSAHSSTTGPRLPRFFPARFQTLLWVLGIFLVVNTIVRIGLAFFEHDWANFLPLRFLAILSTGLLYDLAASTYLLVPVGLIALAWPNSPRGRRGHAIMAIILICGMLAGMLFTGTSEFIFWNEFSSRFNFIAVDYLVYTREVLGNIQESYPVGWILSAIGALACIGVLLLRKPLWCAATSDGGTFGRRLLIFSMLCALPVASFFFIGDNPRERMANASAKELASNGYYEIFRAFRSNDLDYAMFYRTETQDHAIETLRKQLQDNQGTLNFENGSNPITRHITAAGAERPMNVVLVSIESLGADYVGAFGGNPIRTPNLNKLATESLAFTQMYATGLRTVRGLEALTMTMPPTPGHAVPMRKQNKGFQTIGGVFKEHGYESLYIYGGYSYFDNMKDYFGGNGYQVIDRTVIPPDQITHENIWGVADEDLYRLALREIDSRVAAGKKVFAHIMTTSNHRPYTYPAGRVNTPSGKSRAGAVEYTDWAIGEFIREAKQRPWFNNTLFVFIADHTSHGRGRTDLPPENYHIPFLIYAPSWIQPQKIDYVASQIDVAPTILGLLNFSYTSQFFGQNILTEGKHRQRALMANYLTVGYMEDGLVVELTPKRGAKVREAESGKILPESDPRAPLLIDKAISYYQVATSVLRTPQTTAP